MSWFFNAIYICFLVFGSPWLVWRYFTSGKNKRGWSQKLFGFVPRRISDGRRIWMHAVSVGEVNLLAPILNELQARHPELEVVISTTTETGYDLATQKYSEHQVFFCPLDFSWAIKRALKRIRPSMLMLAELEIWPNLIRITRDSGVPVAVVNGRLSENSFRGYQRLKWLVGPTFRRISVVAAQNQTYADRFCRLGCDRERVIITGSVKFDGVSTDRDNLKTQSLRNIAGVATDDWIFIAGSTQIEEDLIAAKVYKDLSASIPNLRLILVPRHPDRCGSLVGQLNQLGIPSVLRSSLGESPQPGTAGKGSIFEDDEANRGAKKSKSLFPDLLSPVLIVDVIGELGAWWGVANASYVGGSMGSRGGQNMIEPAAFGLPVSFGPNTKNFRQLVEHLRVHDAAVVVQNQAELRAFVMQVFEDQTWAADIGNRAQNVVLTHVGASQRTVETLWDLLQNSALPDSKRAAITKAA